MRYALDDALYWVGEIVCLVVMVGGLVVAACVLGVPEQRIEQLEAEQPAAGNGEQDEQRG